MQFIWKIMNQGIREGIWSQTDLYSFADAVS